MLTNPLGSFATWTVASARFLLTKYDDSPIASEMTISSTGAATSHLARSFNFFLSLLSCEPHALDAEGIHAVVVVGAVVPETVHAPLITCPLAQIHDDRFGEMYWQTDPRRTDEEEELLQIRGFFTHGFTGTQVVFVSEAGSYPERHMQFPVCECASTCMCVRVCVCA
jgi:hypothetical protein